MAPGTRDAIATCPVCSHELMVTRLHCEECGTALEGRFTVGRFARLSREQLALLESFLRSRGNLRDMERELGISYPTVRNRVEALVRALGLGGQDVPAAPTEEAPTILMSDADLTPAHIARDERRHILERLARREISAETAASLLRSAALPQDPTRG